MAVPINLVLIPKMTGEYERYGPQVLEKFQEGWVTTGEVGNAVAA